MLGSCCSQLTRLGSGLVWQRVAQAGAGELVPRSHQLTVRAGKERALPREVHTAGR